MDKDLRNSVREENRRLRAEEKERRAEEKKKAQEKKKEERAKAKEEKDRNRQAQRECADIYGSKERFLTRLRSELWKGIPMSSASKKKYSEYLERIGQKDGNKPATAGHDRYCKPLSMIGLSESEIRADLSAYAEKDREDYMEKEAEKLARKKEERDRKAEEKKKKTEEKEESHRINVIRDKNQKDLRSIKSSLWGKYKMTSDSKREYTRLVTDATSRDERFTEDELDDIRENLRTYAESDIEKQKQAYEEKYYNTIREETTDEEGNTVTTERKERKTFCELHPTACATGKAIESGVKKTGETIDRGFTAAGGAIVEGGKAVGRGTKKVADYIMGKSGSDDDDDDLDDEPDISPDMGGDGPERPSGKKPSGKPSKKPKKETEDDEDTSDSEDEKGPSRPQKKPQKKPQRKREERYEEVDETDERDTKEDDDDDGLAPVFRDDKPRSSQRRNTQQCNCSCPVPKKHESEGDSMPPVFAEEPRSKTVTKTEDDDWGMPALFMDDAPAPKKKAKKRTADDDDDGMPALFREDPAPKKKKSSAESMDFSMPALFMDNEPKARSSPAKKKPRAKTGTAKAKTGKGAQTSAKGKGKNKSATKTSTTKNTGKSAGSKAPKKKTPKKPASKKKKKNQSGNDWLTDGDAGLF
ncbi:MAG: hypothetical protein IIY21_05190 [Clostridiales bacterium]|nr:hypothetical protein [Clostridiales bacterium]